MTLETLPRGVINGADREIKGLVTDSLARFGGSPSDPVTRRLMAQSLSTDVERLRNRASHSQKDYLAEIYSPSQLVGTLEPANYEMSAVNTVLSNSWNKQVELYSDRELMHPLDRSDLLTVPGGVSDELTDEAIAKFIDRTVAELGQHVRQAAREAVINTTRKNGDKWQRVMVGKSCAFCALLVSRGAVYSEKTVTFKSHANCDCSAAVVKSINGKQEYFATQQQQEQVVKLQNKWHEMYVKGGRYADSEEARRAFGIWYRSQQ